MESLSTSTICWNKERGPKAFSDEFPLTLNYDGGADQRNSMFLTPSSHLQSMYALYYLLIQ